MNIANQTYMAQDALAINQVSALKQNKGRDMSEAKEAAQDFEAFFLSRMMESMFEGISTNGMFGGGNAEKIYRSFLINEYGKSMAQNGTVGIADYVMKTLLDVQEQQSALTRQEQTQEV